MIFLKIVKNCLWFEKKICLVSTFLVVEAFAKISLMHWKTKKKQLPRFGSKVINET